MAGLSFLGAHWPQATYRGRMQRDTIFQRRSFPSLPHSTTHPFIRKRQYTITENYKPMPDSVTVNGTTSRTTTSIVIVVLLIFISASVSPVIARRERLMGTHRPDDVRPPPLRWHREPRVDGGNKLEIGWAESRRFIRDGGRRPARRNGSRTQREADRSACRRQQPFSRGDGERKRRWRWLRLGREMLCWCHSVVVRRSGTVMGMRLTSIRCSRRDWGKSWGRREEETRGCE